jgi:PST family polysaccharide transporter
MLQSDPARYRRFYLRLLTLVCIITMPLSLFVSIYADGITALLLGPKWMAAAPVLCVLSFSTFIKQAVCSSAFVLITRGKSGGYLGVTVLHNAVLVLAMGIGVRWGILGVAVAEVATTYLLIGPRLYYSLRGSPVTSAGFFATLVRPVVASLVMSYALLAVRWFSATALADNLAFGVAVATVAFGGSLLLMPGGKSELHAVLSDIRAALRRKAAAAAPAPAAVAAN